MDMNLENGGHNTELSPNPDVKKSNKKSKIIAISSVITIVLLVFIGTTAYIHRTVSKYESLIMPGASIEGIDIGGKTKDQVIQELNSKYNDEIGNRNIKIKAGDKEYTINYADLHVKFNIEEAVEEASKYNRDLGYIDKFKAIKSADKKDFPITFTYNNEIINTVTKTMESEINIAKKDATMTKSGSGFNITQEVVGKTLDRQALIDTINAKVSESKLGNIEVVATIKDDIPTKTKEKLSTIDTIIGTKTTNFGTSDSSRSTNIKIGADTLNGIVLMPGESFSFNTIVGDTTADKGYQPGGVYVGDKVEIGYGGGICQVSSTLHNAVLDSGILPDQRLNHNMTVGYVPAGLDATIAYGGIDYVFTNPYKYPIYIEGYTSGGNVTFNIYSNSASKGNKTYGFSSETYETIPVTVKYENDSTLPVGTEKVTQQGAPGYKVKAYRTVYENGNVVSTELMNNDTYVPLPRIIKRGTKKVTEKPVEKPVNKPADKPKEETTPPAEKPTDKPAEGGNEN